LRVRLIFLESISDISFTQAYISFIILLHIYTSTMKNKTLLISLFIIFPLTSLAQTPEKIIEKFFIQYDSLGTEAAINELYSHNKWISSTSDGVINLKSRLATFNEELIGKYYGYEKIVDRKLNDRFQLSSFMVKYERQPLRFTFQFYKPNDNWILYSFKFDDSIDDEIEQSAEIQMLNSIYNN